MVRIICRCLFKSCPQYISDNDAADDDGDDENDDDDEEIIPICFVSIDLTYAMSETTVVHDKSDNIMSVHSHFIASYSFTS